MRQLITCFLTVFSAPKHDDDGEFQVDEETIVDVQQTGLGVSIIREPGV